MLCCSNLARQPGMHWHMDWNHLPTGYFSPPASLRSGNALVMICTEANLRGWRVEASVEKGEGIQGQLQPVRDQRWEPPSLRRCKAKVNVYSLWGLAFVSSSVSSAAVGKGKGSMLFVQHAFQHAFAFARRIVILIFFLDKILSHLSVFTR